ncbi:unnamed protein product [Hydatigera taeniaeformis]|uniref:Cmyb_C domain-containing protein n=1 Tax=Hydatigena taeniaeformis TaxID=6205 RepID=A0A0R3X3Z3_HYDTA|nr:unnamed protein product [Hydatigera taeniaeformis]
MYLFAEDFAAVSGAVLLLSYRKDKQNVEESSCIDEDSLLHLEKNLFLFSPSTTDVDEDIIFDKVRDVFVPKLAKNVSSSNSTLNSPSIEARNCTLAAAGKYDDEFVNYPFYNQRTANKPITNIGPSGMREKGSPEVLSPISVISMASIKQKESPKNGGLKPGLAAIRTVPLTGRLLTPHHQTEVEDRTAKVSKSVVGRVVMTLALQMAEGPFDTMKSCLSLYSLAVGSQARRWRLRRCNPKGCGGVRTNIVEGWHCARFGRTFSPLLPTSWICSSPSEDEEGTLPQPTAQRPRTRSFSWCKAEWSLIQHLELMPAPRRCAIQSHWRQRAEVLECVSIVCTLRLLSLATALWNGDKRAGVKLKEDFHFIKSNSRMS